MRGTVTRYIGRCGVCEGDYKLLSGRLVHHGYRRPGYGSIVGDCFGVGYAPLERSTAASVAYRESCEKAADNLRNYLGRLRAGEVRELTVYKMVGGFGNRREVPELLRADAEDLAERHRFERELAREIAQTQGRIEFFDAEIERMTRLIDRWIERPLRTVEEFEREVESATAAERGARAAERDEKRRAKDKRRAELDAKRAGWVAEKQALMDKYRAHFTRLAEEPELHRQFARELWSEMHRAKARKGYLDFYPKELGVDGALIKLGLAEIVNRSGGISYTNYASAYGGGLTPNESHTPNGGYYVWVLGADGQPLLERPYGPHDLDKAKQLARIGATEGEHNRAVSRGVHPTEPSFAIVREYEAGSGERVV